MMKRHLRRPVIIGIGGTLRKHSSSSSAAEYALRSAAAAGAEVEMLDLETLDLPLYRPNVPLDGYGPGPAHLIESCRRADGIILSTSAYHGTLAGVTKNAIDFLEYLSGDLSPYLEGRWVGVVATAAGEIAAVNAVNALIHVAHALRANVIPLQVPITHTRQAFDEEGQLVDLRWASRLEQLGRMLAAAAAAPTSSERKMERAAPL